MPVTTVGDLVDRVHRMVNGSRRQTFNALALDVTDTATSFTFSQPMEGITQGSHLCVGGEMVYVFDSSTGSQTATVQRGLFDTDGIAHSAGDLVEIDWRWFSADVLSAVADDIRSWPEELYAPRQADIPISGASTAIDCPLTNFRFPLSIRRTVTGIDRYVTEPVNLYRIDTGLPTTSFPSGTALYLPNTNAGQGTARITYASGFATDTLALTTLLSDIPLSNHLIDAALYGAAWRLLIQAESPRSATESQPEPRTVADVHEGSALSTGLRYKTVRDMRLKEEAERLMWLYPMRFG